MAHNAKEYPVRRIEILDTAQRLIYTKGYEQMTIQDILNELQISKGGFFHYFGSKQELLEAVVERIAGEAQKILEPILQDPDLPALEKLQRIYDTSARWKTAQKELMMAIMRVWYADNNAIVRQKLVAIGAKWYVPMMRSIVQQGMAEGILKPAYPDQVADIILTLMQGLGDGFASLFFKTKAGEDPAPGDCLKQHLENMVAAYTDAMERVLGAPVGSLKMMDAETIHEWSSIKTVVD